MSTRPALMIAEARRRAGLTQRQLADRAGVARTAISMYETGQREPGADLFLRLLASSGADLAVASTGIDGAANGEVFLSLTSMLDAGVPVAEPGPLEFPADVWHR